MPLIEYVTTAWRCEVCGTQTEPVTRPKYEHTTPDGWGWIELHGSGIFGSSVDVLHCKECLEKIKAKGLTNG